MVLFTIENYNYKVSICTAHRTNTKAMKIPIPLKIFVQYTTAVSVVWQHNQVINNSIDKYSFCSSVLRQISAPATDIHPLLLQTGVPWLRNYFRLVQELSAVLTMVIINILFILTLVLPLFNEKWTYG